MASTFTQQLRYIRTHEPSLYEAISKAYRKCLTESNLAPQMSQPNDEAAKTAVERTEIKQTGTKGVRDLMAKVHAMVGVNENKKEGSDIFDLTEDDTETVQPIPQQQDELFGVSTSEGTLDDAESQSDTTDELDLGTLFSDESDENADIVADDDVQESTDGDAAPSDADGSTENDAEDDLDLGNLF